MASRVKTKKIPKLKKHKTFPMHLITTSLFLLHPFSWSVTLSRYHGSFLIWLSLTVCAKGSKTKAAKKKPRKAALSLLIFSCQWYFYFCWNYFLTVTHLSSITSPPLSLQSKPLALVDLCGFCNSNNESVLSVFCIERTDWWHLLFRTLLPETIRGSLLCDSLY